MPETILMPIPSPDHPEPAEEKTDPGMFVNAGMLKEKLGASARAAKFQGLVWGAGLIVVSVALAFGGWFKMEAMASEKAVDAVKTADAGADRKLAPLAIDLAVMKNDVGTLKEDVSELKRASAQDKADHAEMLRLLRKR